MTAIPDRVVFDAEPLIAHADDEPGGTVVETYLGAVADGDAAGFINCVNCTEIRYTIARKYDRAIADEYLEWIDDIGVETVGAAGLWSEAAEYVLAYNPALGDAFALATAERTEATLLIGGDGDYDEIDDIPIARFRDGPA